MRSLIISASLCVLVLLLQDSVLQVSTSPTNRYSKVDEYEKLTGEKFTYDPENECKHDAKVWDLCERCAKISKNELAFPFCCSEQKGVRNWCQEFLDYRPVEPILSS